MKNINLLLILFIGILSCNKATQPSLLDEEIIEFVSSLNGVEFQNTSRYTLFFEEILNDTSFVIAVYPRVNGQYSQIKTIKSDLFSIVITDDNGMLFIPDSGIKRFLVKKWADDLRIQRLDYVIPSETLKGLPDDESDEDFQ